MPSLRPNHEFLGRTLYPHMTTMASPPKGGNGLRVEAIYWDNLQNASGSICVSLVSNIGGDTQYFKLLNIL